MRSTFLSSKILILFFSLSLFGPEPERALSAALPNASQEMLKTLKLDPALLANIDRELQVPQDWLEKAKKEGKLRIKSTNSSPEEVKTLLAPFRERYPFIEVEFSGSSQEDRTIKTLVAYKGGRILTDVLSSVGGYIHEFKQANALEDLSAIPNLSNLPDAARDPEGRWVGINKHHWCFAYNTNLVRREDLPKKWEDLLSNTKWRDGNLALGNRPQVWALSLWTAKGEQWTKEFLTRLVSELKPQLRKEGLNALVVLLGSGEFHAAVPALEARALQQKLLGAPVSFTCPEPVPIASEDTLILKGSPNTNAAKLFVNWMLSREGQIASYAARHYVPIHKELQLEALVPFWDQINGKQASYRTPGLEQDATPRLVDFWNNLWLQQGKRL